MALLCALPPDSVLPRKTAASNGSADLPSADLVDSFRSAPFHAKTGASLAQPLAFSAREPFLGGRRPRAPSSRSWPKPDIGERERERANGSDPDVESRDASSGRERLRRLPLSENRVRTSSLEAGRLSVRVADAFGGLRRVGDLDSDRSSARIHLFVVGKGGQGDVGRKCSGLLQQRSGGIGNSLRPLSS